MYDWSDEKAAKNLRQHRVPFTAVYDFEWETASVSIDADLYYGEERCRATGYIRNKIYRLVYTERGNTVWVISLRTATNQEKRDYEEDIG